MLRKISWLIRAGAYVVVGTGIFGWSSFGPVALPVTVTAYALTGLMMCAWAVLDLRGREDAGWRPSPALPYLLGAIAVLAGGASGVPDATSLVALAALAVLDAGSEASLLAGWAVAGAGALAIEIGALIAGAGTGVVLGSPLILLVALLSGRNRRAYRVQAEQAAAMLAQVEQLRAEQRQVAVLDERTRIAREIHDVLAHSLGALGIQIQAARALLTDHGDIERAAGLLGVAQRIASDGLTETRRAVHALRADTVPLDEELAKMAAEHRQRHSTDVQFTVEGDPVPLPPEQTLALVRTAQESLTNTAKHAPHQPVTLLLSYQDDDVTLTIGNPLTDSPAGPAFHTVDGGYGLTGMRERLLLLGGALSAGAESGRWAVTARVPR
ncbi:sensor histidine kinase [Streptomyces sp. NPDC058256]|uniref:sensor histidine kinase n=1 Tax=Streptomyces sp. NPDC058256 TaxID=3346408 RepID=UPI0036E69AE8